MGASGHLISGRESSMAKAFWNDEIVAEGEDVVMLEGNFYFAPDSVRQELLAPSSHTSICPWKGTASYYDIVAGGKRNANAAWYYPDPTPLAKEITGRIAFWKGVKVTP